MNLPVRFINELGWTIFNEAIPVVHVNDSAAAEEFYCNGLGFRLLSAYRSREPSRDPCYLALVRDKAHLHVTSFKDGHAGVSAIYIFVEDVNTLYRESVGRGVQVPHSPIDQTWGTREISVSDPDGNKILFGERIGER
jgi:uncharacterized glyoxalase superfamily protein PhnB